MLVAEMYTRDSLPACSQATERKRLFLAVAGRDCTIVSVSQRWENLSIHSNSVTLAPKVWL